MNNKAFVIHLFSLILFIGGCVFFWLVGGGKEADIKVASKEDDVAITLKESIEAKNNVDEILLISPTVQELGGTISHNTSIHAGGDTVRHPASLSDCRPMPKKSNKKREEKIDVVDAIDSAVTSPSKNIGFHRMERKSDSTKRESIKAVIHDEHKNIRTSSMVKMRLLDDVTINGDRIPKNTVLYAKATLSPKRMYLEIESIKYQKKVYPFNAGVYDLDDEEGIATEKIRNDSKVSVPAGYRLIIKKKE